MKWLKLEELLLKENPLCGIFPNQSTCVMSVVTSVTPPGELCNFGASITHSRRGSPLSSLCVPYLCLEVFSFQ